MHNRDVWIKPGETLTLTIETPDNIPECRIILIGEDETGKQLIIPFTADKEE